MYWRLLTSNPTAAREIVLSEKPVISTETDRMDKGMLDQLLLHTGTLGSIYHKNPNTFIRTARARYLPDSPALNPSSKRHLITPQGFGLPTLRTPSSSPISASAAGPAIPARQVANIKTSGASLAPHAPARGASGDSSSPISPAIGDDPYGQLGDLELLNGQSGGGGYEMDAPRAQREHLLF